MKIVLPVVATFVLFGCSGGGGGGGGNSVPPNATALGLRNVPANAAVGVPLSAFDVTVVDAFGLIVTAGVAQITLSIREVGGTPTSAQLIGETTRASANGVAVFAGIEVDQPGVFVLYATSAGLQEASGSFLDVGAWGQIHEGEAHAVLVRSGRIWLADQLSGILRSEDGGISWTESDAGIANDSFTELMGDPTDGDTVYAASSFPNPTAYKTTDAGSSWLEISTPFDPGQSGIEAIAVDPTDSSRLVGGDDGSTPSAFLSTNGGLDWTGWSAGLPSSFVYDVIIVPTNPPTAFAASGNGIFRRSLNGSSWTQSSIDIVGTSYSLAVDPSDPLRFFAGGESGSIYLSVDGGTNWTEAASFSTGMPNTNFVSIGIDGQGSVYAGAEAGVFKTTDSGSSWSQISVGDSFNPVYSLWVDPTVAGTVYAATRDGLFKTVIGGE